MDIPVSDQAKAQSSFNGNGFSAYASDMISLDRSVPDIRHKGYRRNYLLFLLLRVSHAIICTQFRCRAKKYSSQLPTVSVIIPFFNEHWTSLLRTFHSVINRSPRHLLKEVVLVDDASDLGETCKLHIANITELFVHVRFWIAASCKSQLDDYLRDHGGDISAKVRVVRLSRRQGLIGARQTGARQSNGDVLIFLDSHTEANYNWLPPLLGK